MSGNKRVSKAGTALFSAVISCSAAGGSVSVSLQPSWINISAIMFIFIISMIFIALYAGSETAIVSSNKERIFSLAESGDKHAKIIRSLLLSPDTMLAVVLVGTNLMTTIAGQTGMILAGFAFPGQVNVQQVINTFILTSLILIFCEIIPKVIYRINADRLALSSANMLRISGILLSPLVFLVTRVTGLFVPKNESVVNEGKTSAIREELLLLATMGQNNTGIASDQLKMVYNVLNLESRPVKRVMIPLVEIIALAHTATLEDLFSTVRETGFTRVCIYENRIDNMIGYVNVLEVLQSDNNEVYVTSFIRKNVCFVPELKHVISLLLELNDTDSRIAFIIDEYGGITGMVTMEDLVEEILGEIREENIKDKSQHINIISKDVFECDGNLEIRELNTHAITDIPSGDYETLAGFLEGVLQKIPDPGERVTVGNLSIVVLESDERRIRKIRITRRKMSET